MTYVITFENTNILREKSLIKHAKVEIWGHSFFQLKAQGGYGSFIVLYMYLYWGINTFQ